MNSILGIFIPLLAIYGLFLIWYGGRGKPLEAREIEEFLTALDAPAGEAKDQAALEDLRKLISSDDGGEFVMQNLVRYRAKALYPAGHSYGDDPRAADRRYAKAIAWPLLRHANILLFVARRSGSFVEPSDAVAWHYVAMVRYRSRRDFLRFAVAAHRADTFIHKWAAIEKTHIFPVKPLLSLFFVRASVAAILALVGVSIFALRALWA